jgi:NTE family protein
LAKKIGLCFSGGGARGAYQIGAAKALKDLGILEYVDAYSGTSIGSVNAVALATNPVDKVRDIWFDIPKETLKSTENIFLRLIKEGMDVFEKGLFKIDTLKKILEENVDLDRLQKKNVYVTVSEGGEANERLFGLVRSSFRHYIRRDNKVLYLPLKHQKKDDIIKEVLASCSIPVVFPGVNHNHKKYYDGGMYDNVPVKPLVEHGCDPIIVVHLHRIRLFDPNKYPDVTFHEIKHKGSLGGILNFDSEQSRKLHQYGYDDTMAYFQEHPINL